MEQRHAALFRAVQKALQDARFETIPLVDETLRPVFLNLAACSSSLGGVLWAFDLTPNQRPSNVYYGIKVKVAQMGNVGDYLQSAMELAELAEEFKRALPVMIMHQGHATLFCANVYTPIEALQGIMN